MQSWGRVFVLFMCLGVLAGCGGHGYAGKLVKQYGGEKTRPDVVAERFIVLVRKKDGEKVAARYFHDGQYDQRALARINHLMRDERTGTEGKIDRELIDFLVDIRARLGLPPGVVFEILSGYRTAESNALLAVSNGNVAKESLHVKGLAVDFRIAGVSGKAIAEIAKTMQRGGVSYYPRDNHVHVDIGNIRSWAAG